MARPELHVIRHLRETLDRPEKLLRRVIHAPPHAGGFLKQVGSADIADENEIAGERAYVFVAAGEIADEESQMLWRVSRSVRDSHANGANVNLGSVMESVATLERFPRVAELAALARQVQLRAGSLGELASPGKEVCVDVSFRHVRDAQAIGACRTRVYAYIGIRIDEDRLAGRLTRDQIACLCKIVVVKTLEEHAPGRFRKRCWKEYQWLAS